MSIPILKAAWSGDDLALLSDILRDLRILGLEEQDILFRASGREDLDRLLTYGTDRGGVPPGLPWLDGDGSRSDIAHEDVIFAVTADEVRRGAREPEFSTSFKKLAMIEQPLMAIYDARAFEKLAEKQYRFLNGANKLAALKAIFELEKRP